MRNFGIKAAGGNREYRPIAFAEKDQMENQNSAQNLPIKNTR